MDESEYHRPKTYELDEHDLGAHSRHLFRLFGGETVRVTDLRGEPSDTRLDVTVKVLNVELVGRLSTLRAFGVALTEVLDEAATQPERWADVPGHKARFSDEPAGFTSPFYRQVPIPPRDTSEGA